MKDQRMPQWEAARQLRNRLLSESDYLVSCAYEQGNPVSSELKAYRQALRDLPETFSDPAEIVWPNLNPQS
jgi:hypothetical protein